jgi:pyruvyltransferase
MYQIKKAVRRVQYIVNNIMNSNTIKIDYAVKMNNFGDILNPIVVEHFTGKKTTRVAAEYTNKIHLLGIGSILNRANENSIVWGSGFIKDQSFVVKIPKKILAVRGPRTRKRLLDLNIECPEIYGDPALLMPHIYNPIIEKKYELGIIPHYVDYNDERFNSVDENSILIIDICNPNPLKVIDQLLQCKNIASSSLHGLIVSDAYGIPNVWIKFSDKIVGGDFKFLDYFDSINRKTEIPYKIRQSIVIQDLLSNCKSYEVNLDLNALIKEINREFTKY